MTDVLTKSQRRKNMQSIRSKDTKIEILLRKALWHRGIRYRKNYSKIPGKPDIAITKYKIAVFCDSEFFHGKDWDALKPRLLKGNNPEFWIDKIEKNRKHDQEINHILMAMGWTVIRFWERDITKHLDECIRTVEEAILNVMVQQDE